MLAVEWQLGHALSYRTGPVVSHILPRSIGSPTDFTDSLLRAVGQPRIFGTPLVVRQRIKYSLSTA